MAYIRYDISVSDFSTMKAGDDAAHAEFVPCDKLISGEARLAFDHGMLLAKLLDSRGAK